MFNAKGGDGVAVELPQGWRPRQPIEDGLKQPKKHKLYGQTVRFQLPQGSVVEVALVITSRQRWEKRMKDKTGWTVMPFLSNWVILLRLSI